MFRRGIHNNNLIGGSDACRQCRDLSVSSEKDTGVEEMKEENCEVDVWESRFLDVNKTEPVASGSRSVPTAPGDCSMASNQDEIPIDISSRKDTGVEEMKEENCEVDDWESRFLDVNKTEPVASGSRSVPTAPGDCNMASTQQKLPMDISSRKGKFGWTSLGDRHIPFLERSKKLYSAVRIVEMEIIAKYKKYLHKDIYTCIKVKSYYLTESEARLLTEINVHHSEGSFGQEPFTVKDLVILVEDAQEFYHLMDFCIAKINNPLSGTKRRCGFLRINKRSAVPYITNHGEDYLPLFYFEGETDTLRQKSVTLASWDLAYIRFCCKIQGIDSDLINNDLCEAVRLEDIRAYFPRDSTFEEYWPPKVLVSQLFVEKDTCGAQGNMDGAGMPSDVPAWIQVPPEPIRNVAISPVSVTSNRRPPQSATVAQPRRYCTSYRSRVQQAATLSVNSNTRTRTFYSRTLQPPNMMRSRHYYPSHRNQPDIQVVPPPTPNRSPNVNPSSRTRTRKSLTDETSQKRKRKDESSTN